MGHLNGTRVSALLDGQLSAAEAEQAWAHVYACRSCREHVEREGWVKARLAGLSGCHGVAPDHLRGSLYRLTPGERYVADPRAGARDLGHVAGDQVGQGPQGRRAVALVGSGAVGAAMLGVLALGVAPASTPTDRRPTGGVTEPVSTTVPRQPAGPVAVAVTGATAVASSPAPSSTADPTTSGSPAAPPASTSSTTP